MGSFIANIHLFIPSADMDRLRVAQSLLLAHAESSPYEPAAQDQTVDRTTRLVASGPQWVTVYDEDAETMDSKWLDGLAAALSMPPVAAAISVLINDSDEGVLTLFRHGERVARIRLEAGKAVRFNRRWREVFPRLPAALEPPEAFAEEPIEKIAALLGCAPEFVVAGLSDRRDLPTAAAVDVPFTLRREHQFLLPDENPYEVVTPTLRTHRIPFAIPVPTLRPSAILRLTSFNPRILITDPQLSQLGYIAEPTIDDDFGIRCVTARAGHRRDSNGVDFTPPPDPEAGDAG
jgi:hypothetical protein